MDKLESIKLINDLVMRTEKGEITWSKTDYSNHFSLKNTNGEIHIGKKTSKDITFKITGSRGAVITDNSYLYDNNEDLQLYKISNVLWQLVKDFTQESKVNLNEIMELLEEDDDNRTVELDLKNE